MCRQQRRPISQSLHSSPRNDQSIGRCKKLVILSQAIIDCLIGDTLQWERQAFGNPEKPEHNRIYVFPEQDLLDTLVHRYFEEGNSIMPLLHRPSFEAGLTEGLHFRDDGFARVLLLVCAIGSGYVDDPSVLLKDESGLSSGWRWFSQITLGGNALLALPSLYDLQVCCVCLFFDA
jgi:hypothetical protein